MNRSQTRATLQQPYFLPWIGFLRKLAAADLFVSLDTATFRRNHLGRSAVLGPQGRPLWLTVPAGASQNQPIHSIRLPTDDRYLDRFTRVLAQSYGNAPHINEMKLVQECLSQYYPGRSLAQANFAVITTLISALGLSVQVVEESSLRLRCRESATYDRDEHVVHLLRIVGAATLVTGDGSSSRVHDFAAIEQSGIGLTSVRAFDELAEYPQWQRRRADLPFVAGLSFVDCLLNTGLDGLRAQVQA